MDTIFQSLFFREPLIHYVSPPLCENLFSSSSGPVIVLNTMDRLTAITGLVMGGVGDFFLRWGVYPGAICYSVYMSTDPGDPFGTYVLVAECIPNPEYYVGDLPDGTFIHITAITPEGETPFGTPIEVVKIPAACPSFVLPLPTDIVASPGDDVSIVFTVNEGAGFGLVNYIWLKDGLFFDDTTFTTKGTLNLDDVGASDSGIYELELSNVSPACAVTSVPIDVSVIDCVPDTGDPAPSGPTAFNIAAEVVWPTELLDFTDGIMSYSVNPFDIWHYTEFSDDYPPGTYDLEYVSGAILYEDTGGGAPYSAYAYKHVIVHSDVALSYAGMGAANLAYLFSGNFYIEGPGAVSIAAAVTALETNYGGSRFASTGVAVTNDKLPVRICIDDISWSNAHAGVTGIWWTDAYSFSMRLVQKTGLIQQPRELHILGWPDLSMDPDITDNWNGIFTARSAYTSTTCTHDVAASLGFGGASVSYTQAHPTAPNGCGWVLEILKGVTSYWKGYKEVGDSALGTYMRAAGYTDGPECFVIEESD